MSTVIVIKLSKTTLFDQKMRPGLFIQECVACVRAGAVRGWLLSTRLAAKSQGQGQQRWTLVPGLEEVACKAGKM